MEQRDDGPSSFATGADQSGMQCRSRSKAARHRCANERQLQSFVPLNVAAGGGRYRIVQDRKTEVDLLIAHRERRGYPEDGALAGDARDIHRQAKLETHFGDRITPFIVRLPGATVLDDLHPDEEAVSAYVAHAFVFLHEASKARFEPRPGFSRPLAQLIA